MQDSLASSSQSIGEMPAYHHSSRPSSISSMGRSSGAGASPFSPLTMLDGGDESASSSSFFSERMSASSSSMATTPEPGASSTGSAASSACASPNALRPASATLSFAASILAAEARALQAATARLEKDVETQVGFERAVDVAIRAVQEEGKIIWCGVGKSGLIARKLCASALSLGLASVFLHPTEALHGDLGIVHTRDVVMLLSYSGGSSEVTALLPHLAARGSRIVALCGKPSATLVQQHAHAWVDCRMPALPSGGADDEQQQQPKMEGEAWDEVPAPSSTTTLTLAMGDALIFTIARELGKGKADFALNHPNGSLGQAMRDQGLRTCAAG